MTDVLSAEDLGTSRPVLRDDVLVRHFDLEAVAWSPIAPQPIYLDPLSSVIFQMLDGHATTDELAADVHEIIGVPKSVALSQIARAVALFERSGMLHQSPAADLLDLGLDIFPAPPNP